MDRERNVVTPTPPEELLQERVIERLIETGEVEDSLIVARDAYESLNDAQRVGVGNLGLSLEQVRNPNYTQYTPEAIILSIEGDANFQLLSDTEINFENRNLDDALNEARPELVMGGVRRINQIIIHSRVEGEEINYYNAVIQLSEENQRRIAINLDYLEDVRAETLAPISQEVANPNANQPSNSETSIKPLEVASMPENHEEEKDSFTKKELKRRKDSNSRDSDDDKKPPANPNKKPRNR